MKTKIIAILIAVVVLAGVGSAALLNHYAELDGKAVELQQSIVVGGNNYDVLQEYEITNETPERVYQNSFTVENRAELPGYVTFVTVYSDSTVMTTRYLGTVDLCSKDSSWDCTTDMEGTLTYELNNDKFVFEFEATGLDGDTEYSLIYYADKPDRFVVWGGNNPGALIGGGMTNAAGDLVIDSFTGGDVINLGMDMPHGNDYNTGDYYDSDWFRADYGENNNGHDDFDMRTGAKIWLVPTADYNVATKTVTNWNPGDSLFESDLINYDDTNAGVNGLRIGAYSSFELIIETEFKMDAEPDTYTVTTTIIPA